MSKPAEIQSAMRNQPWNELWGESDLEHVRSWPVCFGTKRSLLYTDMVDNVFYCAPGKWTSYSCSDCGSMYLDPRPTKGSIHRAYETYYTHSKQSPKPDYATLSPLKKIRRRLVNGYTNWRFSTAAKPASALGIAVMWLLFPFKLELDHEYRNLPRKSRGEAALLDVVCGNGTYLEIAKSCGWRVTGIDPDHKCVVHAKNLGLDVLEGGIERFENDANRFDAITLNHVIEHVYKPGEVLKAWAVSSLKCTT